VNNKEHSILEFRLGFSRGNFLLEELSELQRKTAYYVIFSNRIVPFALSNPNGYIRFGFLFLESTVVCIG
jgi:hypothetical protein